jgi:hypothetical protein
MVRPISHTDHNTGISKRAWTTLLYVWRNTNPSSMCVRALFPRTTLADHQRSDAGSLPVCYRTPHLTDNLAAPAIQCLQMRIACKVYHITQSSAKSKSTIFAAIYPSLNTCRFCFYNNTYIVAHFRYPICQPVRLNAATICEFRGYDLLQP